MIFVERSATDVGRHRYSVGQNEWQEPPADGLSAQPVLLRTSQMEAFLRYEISRT